MRCVGVGKPIFQSSSCKFLHRFLSYRHEREEAFVASNANNEPKQQTGQGNKQLASSVNEKGLSAIPTLSCASSASSSVSLSLSHTSTIAVAFLSLTHAHEHEDHLHCLPFSTIGVPSSAGQVYLGEQYVNNPILSDVTFLVEDSYTLDRWMLHWIFAQDLLRAADQSLLEGLKRLCEYTIAKEVAESVKQDFASIDILVHSLANGPEVTKPLLETSRKGYLAAISASSYSYVSLLKHFVPIMNPVGSSISLTYIASERIIPGYGGGMSSAKAALESDTKIDVGLMAAYTSLCLYIHTMLFVS